MSTRAKPSPFLDTIPPKGFDPDKYMFCCEQCTYFDPTSKKCMNGFLAKPHLRQTQLKRYYITGKMALCRFHEID